MAINGENIYLRHLTYEGAKERYLEITDDIKDRIDFADINTKGLRLVTQVSPVKKIGE